MYQSIPKLPIHHLHISHNAPCLPTNTLHNRCFQFLMGNTVHGPERNQKTVLFQNFGGQTREINVGNGGFTLLCKPPGIFKNQKERKGMLTFIDIAVLSDSNTSAKFTEKLSNSSTKIWKLKLIGCGK